MQWVTGVRDADYDIKIRLVILGIQVPVVRVRSAGGTEDIFVGKGWHDTFDFQHVAFDDSLSDPGGTLQNKV